MGLKVITQPTIQAVSTEDLKDHLNIIHDEKDDLIDNFIEVARETLEKRHNVTFATKTILLTFDKWPDFPVELPKPPLAEVTKIEYKDDEGNVTEWDSANYVVDEYSFIPRVALADDYDIPTDDLYPVNAIQITYDAGYSSQSDIPATYKHAIKLLVGEWWNNREETVDIGAVPQKIKDGVDALMGLDGVKNT